MRALSLRWHSAINIFCLDNSQFSASTAFNFANTTLKFSSWECQKFFSNRKWSLPSNACITNSVLSSRYHLQSLIDKIFFRHFCAPNDRTLTMIKPFLNTNPRSIIPRESFFNHNSIEKSLLGINENSFNTLSLIMMFFAWKVFVWTLLLPIRLMLTLVYCLRNAVNFSTCQAKGPPTPCLLLFLFSHRQSSSSHQS